MVNSAYPPKGAQGRWRPPKLPREQGEETKGWRAFSVHYATDWRPWQTRRIGSLGVPEGIAEQ